MSRPKNEHMSVAFFSVALSASLALVALSATADGVETWSDKNWSVSLTSGKVAQDSSDTCVMQANDNVGILQMAISYTKTDAGPPDMFPKISFVRGLGEDGQPMAVESSDLLSSWKFDGTNVVHTTFDWDFASSKNIFTVPTADTQELLAAMAKGHQLSLNTALYGDQSISLLGFSAVYRKMSTWCDFSIVGVL